MTRRSIQISTYIMAPMMMGLAFVGEPLVRLILTDKWLPAVPYLRVFCIVFMFYPIHTANLNAIKAMGRSDLFLKLEIVKKIVGMAALLTTMWISVKAMAYSMLATSILSQIINSWPNRKLLDYGYLEQIKDIIPSIALAVVMGVCVWLVGCISMSLIIKLLFQVTVGIVIYFFASYMLRIEPFMYSWNLIKSKLNVK